MPEIYDIGVRSQILHYLDFSIFVSFILKNLFYCNCLPCLIDGCFVDYPESSVPNYIFRLNVVGIVFFFVHFYRFFWFRLKYCRLVDRPKAMSEVLLLYFFIFWVIFHLLWLSLFFLIFCFKILININLILF